MCPLKKYPMEMPMLFLPQNWIQGTSHHYSDGLTEDAWAHFLLPVKWFSPDIFGSVSFLNASCENHSAHCLKLVLGQWLVHAFAALGLSRCHQGPRCWDAASTPQLRRAPTPAGDHQAGEDPSVRKGTSCKAHGLISRRTRPCGVTGLLSPTDALKP